MKYDKRSQTAGDRWRTRIIARGQQRARSGGHRCAMCGDQCVVGLCSCCGCLLCLDCADRPVVDEDER